MPIQPLLSPLPANRVEVYDFDTQNVGVLPTSTLTRTMAPMRVPEIGRVCWVDTVRAAQLGRLPEPASNLGGRTRPSPTKPIPVQALRDEATRERLRLAVLVVGIDRHSGSDMLFYGAEVVQEIVRTGIGAQVPTIHFLYDARTDSLEYLCAAVEFIKGSCCYGGTAD